MYSILKIKISSLFVLTLLIFSGCSNGPMIEGFDSEQWKADSKGCNGVRKSMAAPLLNNKEKLKKYRYEQVLQFMGRPDILDRYNRGKKTIKYFIEPGKQCEDGRTEKAEKLVFEIGPLGEVSMVRSEKTF